MFTPDGVTDQVIVNTSLNIANGVLRDDYGATTLDVPSRLSGWAGNNGSGGSGTVPYIPFSDASAQIFNTCSIDVTYGRNFQGIVSTGNSILYLPFGSAQTSPMTPKYDLIVQYLTTDSSPDAFTNSVNWKHAYLTTLLGAVTPPIPNTDYLRGFLWGTADDHQRAYLVPFGGAWVTSNVRTTATFAQYDPSVGFVDDPNAWQVFTPPGLATPGYGVTGTGYTGGTFDGVSKIFYAPNIFTNVWPGSPTSDYGDNSIVRWYDYSLGSFTNPAAWGWKDLINGPSSASASATDLVGTHCARYQTAITANGFVYLIQFWNNQSARIQVGLDPTVGKNWEAFDLTSLDPQLSADATNPIKWTGACTVNDRWLFLCGWQARLTPKQSIMAFLNLQAPGGWTDRKSWVLVDASVMVGDFNAMGYIGCFSDGVSVYLAPSENANATSDSVTPAFLRCDCTHFEPSNPAAWQKMGSTRSMTPFDQGFNYMFGTAAGRYGYLVCYARTTASSSTILNQYQFELPYSGPAESLRSAHGMQNQLWQDATGRVGMQTNRPVASLETYGQFHVRKIGTMPPIYGSAVGATVTNRPYSVAFASADGAIPTATASITILGPNTLSASASPFGNYSGRPARDCSSQLTSA